MTSNSTNASRRTFHAVNPATGESLEPGYAYQGAAEVDAAAKRAKEAFEIFRETGGKARAAFLRRIASEIEDLGDELITRVMAETALPEGRVRSERGRTCGQLRMFADLIDEGSWVDARIDHAEPTRAPQPKPDTRFMLRGIGPVAVFGPANFPLAFSTAGGDTASALAAGCPVVVKAHSSHPGTCALVGAAISKALAACDLPEGIFSQVFGSGAEVGAALVSHPDIKAVGFTGSQSAGRSLFNLAASRPAPIPVFAEMSSLNPVLLLPGALDRKMESIAAGLHASVTLGVGQFCTNPGLILMEKRFAAPFAALLRDHLSSTPACPMLNAGTRRSYVEGLQRIGGQPQVDEILGHTASPGPGSAHARPALYQTDAATFLATTDLHEEVFGPATLLVHYEDRGQLAGLIESLQGHLTATVHGLENDIEDHRKIIETLATKVGRVVFNSFPTGVEVNSSMCHSGPYPATTDCRFTSVGSAAILRFVRPVCYQDCPTSLLPPELRDSNPLGIRRLVNGQPEQPA